MADQKISVLTTMAGSDVDGAADYITLLDMSEADAVKNKKMLFDQLRVGLFCGAMVEKTTDQTAANYSAGVNMTWDGESYDVGGWHDNVTNNSRLTVPASRGITKVRVAASIYVGGATFTAASTFLVELLKNGSAVFDGAITTNPWPAGSATSLGAFLMSGAIPATDADYFEIKLTSSDTSITVTADRSSFSIQAVG